MRNGVEGLRLSLALALATAAALAGCGDAAAPDQSGAGDRAKPLRGEVLNVVDGDTIDVALEGGETVRVRYIGVNTPESVDPDEPVQCFAHAASRANARLVDGRTVRLITDRELYDAYDRLLAYVYAPDGRLVNAVLVARGYARTLEFEPNTAKASLFARLQADAGRAGRGLWGAC